MRACLIPALFISLLICGCHHDAVITRSSPSPRDEAAAANALFFNQKTFDPWVLKSLDSGHSIPFYACNGQYGRLYAGDGSVTQTYIAGRYVGGQLTGESSVLPSTEIKSVHNVQKLNMRDGTFSASPEGDSRDIWPQLWQNSDIIISGDPEAQQVTHANLFYLLSSTYPGSNHSIPPMGLSSNLYGGHIFWDAEVFMLPALIAQHPEYARPIIDYRYKLLGQAERNAREHGFAGAEYPWESADTGKEMAGAEFAKERHVTADVGWAAWQYYLWTGDKAFLRSEGWPILKATATYWTSRVSLEKDHKYHIRGVIGPDETAGVVDDDAWTNGVVQANLQAATNAAQTLGQRSDPRWKAIADHISIPFDPLRGIPSENSQPMTDRFEAKQADAMLLCYPLKAVPDPSQAAKMLEFYTTHTIQHGPAMTSSMEAIVAAQLGRRQESLALFHESYRPFMRGPWDAFAEKRTSNRVYFCTGMGGCLQSILYGFAGLQIAEPGGRTIGKKIAGDREASLYASPHLPLGWGGLTLRGVRFRGSRFNLLISRDNHIKVTQ